MRGEFHGPAPDLDRNWPIESILVATSEGVEMTQQYKLKEGRSEEYATSADFCHIFEEQMTSMYVLSFLLTADPEKAEQCLVSGIEGCVNSNAVFKEWAPSWARLTIIQNAIQAVAPRRNNENENWKAKSSQLSGKVPAEGKEHANLACILGLDPFERFVYVMSVIQRYTDQHCSVLLGCKPGDVIVARTRALQQIGSAIEFHLELQVNVG
jgi:hypothetical protein